jgi:signal transduction histidine kinase
MKEWGAKKLASMNSEKTIYRFSVVLLILAFAVLVGMILILTNSVQRAENLDTMENERGNYENIITDFSNGSDYLTEQVWEYATSGDITYMQNYWNEVENTRSRDKSIEKLLHANLTDQERNHVLRAKAYSDTLIAGETRSMRMLAESYGVPESSMPQRVRDYTLSADDQALGADQKRAQVQQYLFGSEYMASKSSIRSMVESFRNDLSARLEYETSSALEADRIANRYAVAAVTILMILMIALIYIFSGMVKRKNEELESSLESANAASRAKGYFTSRMSHEIRTPLNAVMGYLYLARHAADEKEKADSLEKSEIAASTLLNIVNDVLDLSAIESGKTKLTAEPFSAGALLGEIQVVYAAMAESKGITFEVDAGGITSDMILGDAMRLNQILTNLMSNAMKFTPEGGRILLKGSQSPKADGVVSMCFEISDTGIGMSPEFIAHIYDAYEQENASIHQKYGGSGLGMSIVKSLVDLMQGTIDVISAPGKGTTFTVTFNAPIAPQAPGTEALEAGGTEAAKPRDGADIDLSGMRVMVAEDNVINLEIARKILSSAGVEVQGAADGKKALEFFEASAPGYYDAILMDIIMPEMDGYETTRRIRGSNHPDGATIPIIAMSANAFESDVKKSLESGMNGHIAKPVDVPLLLATLGKYKKN